MARVMQRVTHGGLRPGQYRRIDRDAAILRCAECGYLADLHVPAPERFECRQCHWTDYLELADWDLRRAGS